MRPNRCMTANLYFSIFERNSQEFFLILKGEIPLWNPPRLVLPCRLNWVGCAWFSGRNEPFQQSRVYLWFSYKIHFFKVTYPCFFCCNTEGPFWFSPAPKTPVMAQKCSLDLHLSTKDVLFLYLLNSPMEPLPQEPLLLSY